IKFINQNTGFMCGREFNNSARILKTTNGGNNWLLKYNAGNSLDQLNSIAVLSANTLIAVGGSYNYDSEGIVKSSDGGETWNDFSNITSPSILMTTGFFNQTTGIALGYYGKMIRTTDMGISWTSLNLFSNNSFYVNTVTFTDNQTGLLLCNNGKIMKTGNGGALWDTVSIPTTANLNNGFIFGNNYYVISNNTFFRSSNSGNNWQITNTGRGIGGADFINQYDGFMVGSISDSFYHHTTFF